jgi:23S rRNA (adenine2503-C2)-methyltransferase
MRSLYDLSYHEVEELVAGWGEPSYRAEQLWNGLYQHYYQRAEQLTVFPLELRSRLAEDYDFHTLVHEQEILSDDETTRKVLFRLEDDQAIETVLMLYDDRRTLCISSQAGCAMGCDFCATGQMGFRRHLTAGEIVEQVVFFERELSSKDDRLTNIVFMGMGEPFHNYQQVMDAVEILTHSAGLNFGARRITISTVGVVPGIEKFTREDTQVNLAVSLHAVDNQLRSRMMPINRKYPVEVLMNAVREYLEMTNRRVTFEWALIAGVNDSLEQAHKLADWLEDMLAHVNLIPLNPTRNYAGVPTADDQARRFQEVLISRGIPCTIRLRRGIEIQAGCGQLASQSS